MATITGQTATINGPTSDQGPGVVITPTPTTPPATIAPPAGNLPVPPKTSVAMDSTYTNVPSAYMTPELKAYLDTNTKNPSTSNPNAPSSSATVPLATNASNATNTATTNNGSSANAANANALFNTISSQGISGISAADLQTFLDQGMSSSDAVNMAVQLSGVKDAKAAGEDAKQNQAAMYNAELASQSAQYASAFTQLTHDRANAHDTAQQQLAALNSSGGIGSDSGAFISHIDATYDLAQQQLNLQGQQAKAALDQGNAAAYANITQNMNKTINDVKTNISNLLGTIQSNKVGQANFETQEKDKNATLYRDTLTQLPLGQADAFASLPSDASQLDAKQSATFKGTTAYQQGHAAGLSDQAILGDLRTLSTTPAFAQQKINNQAVQASARLAIAQANLADKEAGSIDAATIGNAPGGQPFLAAFQQAVGAGTHTKDSNSTTLSSIAAQLQSGSTDGAKQTLTNYLLANVPSADRVVTTGLMNTAAVAQSLKDKINALPKDQQTGLLTGNFQDLSARLGQNPNPELAKIGAEFGHLQQLYVRQVFGVRAATSDNSIYKNLYPKIQNSKSLNLSTLDGLINTANDSLDASIQSQITPDTFQSIYGDHVLTGKGGGSGQTWQGLTVGQQMKYTDGKTYTITANGPVPVQ